MQLNLQTKKIIILMILLIVIVLLIFTFFLINYNSDKNIFYVRLNKKVYDIYEWKYDIKDDNIVKFVEKKQFGDVDNKNGGNITEKYYFKALKPGKTELTFTFTNTGNGSYLDTKYYLVKVDKKKNINIEEVSDKS